jgi:putative DNA primase/helicase
VNFKKEYTAPVKWLNFLKQLFRSEDDIKTLQEYMGYGLIPTTIAQKMLFITGNGGEGKSVIGSVYKQILGANNSYSAHVNRLQERPCELANCVNKLVNIDDDTQIKSLEDTGTIKEIITGGHLTVERKYRDPQDVVLYSRLLCFSNGSLRALYDHSDGFYRRQLVIRTKPKDKNRIDNPNLVNEIISEELSDIFMWAVHGLYRLMENNYQFTVSEDSKKLIEDTKREDFNFIDFIENEDEVVFKEDSKTTSASIYHSYERWCENNAYEPISRNLVLGWLKDHAEEYKIKPDCNVINPYNHKRCRGFSGMAILRD